MNLLKAVGMVAGEPELVERDNRNEVVREIRELEALISALELCLDSSDALSLPSFGAFINQALIRCESFRK